MPNRFERKETYKPEEVLPFLPRAKNYPKNFKLKKVTRDYDGDPIKMGSERYYTFEKSLKCCFCGVKGVFFAKERHVRPDGTPLQNGAFHLNLYAIDENGNEVLMTKDHIIPKARGGKNRLSNYQTACAVCNEEKRATKDEKYRETIKKRKNAK